MSFTSLKPYFRARMKALNFAEHTDAFNVDNIPSTKIDKAFHIELLPASYQGTAHVALAFKAQVRIKAYAKGYKTPAEAVDKCQEWADSIVKECCKSTNRLTQTTGLKNVLPTSVDTQALNQTNDNVAYLELTFDATIFLDPDA